MDPCTTWRAARRWWRTAAPATTTRSTRWGPTSPPSTPGAEGLECDVRLTADGHLVCVHDRRVDRVTNGRGVVSTMELAQLDELDFASWKNPWADLDDEAPEIDEETRRVLTLRRLLEVVRDYDRPVDLAIETKHPTRYAGLVERRLVDLLDEVGWAGADSPARVMSFSPVALTRVKKLAPELEVVLLIDRQYSWQMATSVLGPGWIAGPGIDLLRENPRLGRRLRKRGRRIHVWTVNEPDGPRPVRGRRGRGGDHRRPAAGAGPPRRPLDSYVDTWI